MLTLLRHFPKAIAVVGIFVVSTGLFALWWFNRGGEAESVASAADELKVAIAENEEKVVLGPP